MFTHEVLAPKARSSYGFLHLMARDTKPMRFVVAVGIKRLSIQPLLLEHLAERLRHRVKREGPDPWKREYVSACTSCRPWSLAGRCPVALPGGFLDDATLDSPPRRSREEHLS